MDNHGKSETSDSISDLISLGEGFTTEFKRSVTSDLGKEICAFANATGGTVLIGVDDSGKVCGVADHNRLKSEIQSTARSANPAITVEIVSPGGLPAGMTEANLGTRSIPRNPLLFGLLHRMEMVEKIGSGIRRIRDLCRQHRAEEPVIEVSDSWVTVTFPRLTAQDSREVGTKSKFFVAACQNSQ